MFQQTWNGSNHLKWSRKIRFECGDNHYTPCQKDHYKGIMCKTLHKPMSNTVYTVLGEHVNILIWLCFCYAICICTYVYVCVHTWCTSSVFINLPEMFLRIFFLKNGLYFATTYCCWFCNYLLAMFSPLNTSLECSGELATMKLLYIQLVFPAEVLYRGVPGFANDYPCCVLCRRLTTCLRSESPCTGNLVF